MPHTEPEVSSKNVLSTKFALAVDKLPESEIAKGLSRFSPEEQKLRIELAAAYRYFGHMNWDEVIYNHITVRVPSPDPSVHHFLINPFGLRFDEVTASSLIKIDIDGNVIDPGNSGRGILLAGYIIHSAVHKARPDLHCIAHTHSLAGSAVSCMKFGLLPLHQIAQTVGEVAYHDYEGIAVDEGERERLVQNLGPSKKVMILRNHGLLTAGAHVGEAVYRMYILDKACEIQVKALSAGFENLIIPSKESLERNVKFLEHVGPQYGLLEFEAIIRLMESKDPSFKL